MDLTLRQEAFGVENQSWLGSADGTDAGDSITLDGASLGAVFTDGVVPSGVLLAKITATGLWGPYDSTASDGRESAAQAVFLFTTVKLNNAYRGDASNVFHNVQAAALWRGEIVAAKLPVTSGPGFASSTAKTALAGRFYFV